MAAMTRRTPQEVRELLLGAARSTFAARGYAGSSTREIADAAGVSEALLFRHFGTKANLFELAVLDPFHAFMEGYVEGRPDPPGGSPPPEVPTRDYIETLYDILTANHELVMALLAARAFEVERPASPELSGALDRLEPTVATELARRGLTDVDVPVTIRVTFAMVVALAVFQDWRLPPEHRPDRQRIIDEMVQFMVHGLARDGAVRV